MRKYICFAGLLLVVSNLFAQNNCSDFDNVQTTNLLGQIGTNAQIGNGFGNWMQRCSQMGVYNDINSLNGTNYLFLNDVGCSNGGSIVWNSIDYSGNWIANASCLCYDFNVIRNGNNKPPPPSILTIYNGADPLSSTLSATFVLNSPIIEGSGWYSICPPIALSDDVGNLPSNNLGFWRINNNGTAGDWDTLITNVGGIMFSVDIGGSPTEQYGIDNICFQNCPPNQQPNTPVIFPECCENKLNIEKDESFQSQIVNVPTGYNGSDPFSTVQYQYTITQNSVIPITEFRAVITDIDFNYDLEACAECIDNPALWGSIGGSLYVGDELTNTDPGNNILNDRYNRREVIWKNKDGAMLEQDDTFTIDFGLPPLSEIPCCVTSVTVCMEFSYKDANCKVCVEPICVTIDLSTQPKKVGALDIDVKKKGCCERTLMANADVSASYLWNTGDTTQNITVGNNGTYTVTATSGGVSITQSVVVNDILKGAFPLLSFNSLFHPDLVPPYKNKFYIMDVSPGKINQGIPNSYNANEYILEIYHEWNTSGGQGNPLKRVTGVSDTCTGFNNWDIFWDGTDQSGASLKEEKGESYVWWLKLKNCNNESSRLTYKTSWVPVCEEPRYLFPKWEKIRIGCKKWGGYWNTETFEFGDVQMTK